MQFHTGDLFAVHSRQQKLSQFTPVLDRLIRLVDWPSLAKIVNDATGREQDRPQGGRPPYPTQALLKIIVLQQLYGNLSDEEMEYALLDRMSWQHFIGLALARDLPDARTIWAFKNPLAQVGGAATLLADVQRPLATAGLMAQGGQLIDATPANVSDTTVFAPLLDTTPERSQHGKIVHADRGYDSAKNRATLKSSPLRDGIARKDDRKRYDQTDIHQRNQRLAKIRGRVEHVLGGWEKTMGKPIRCVGLVRAKAAITLQALVYHLRRWVTLDSRGASAA